MYILLQDQRVGRASFSRWEHENSRRWLTVTVDTRMDTIWCTFAKNDTRARRRGIVRPDEILRYILDFIYSAGHDRNNRRKRLTCVTPKAGRGNKTVFTSLS